jgi:hypothetical protein
MVKEKQCKYCGTKENLIERTIKGQFQIVGVCKQCWYENRHNNWINKTEEERKTIKNNIANGTKIAMENLSEDKKKEMVKNHNDSWFSRPEEERNEIASKRGEAISNSPKNEERCRKIGDYWINASDEIIDNRTEKARKTLDSRTDEEKEYYRKRKSEANFKSWKENKEQRLNKYRKTWDLKSKEEKENIIYKRLSGWRKFSKEIYPNMNIEEKYEFNKPKIEKWKNTRSNWTVRQRQSNSNKIRETILIRLQSNKKFQSKVERRCLEYIKINIDENINYQKRYNNWMIDFYSPKLDLYIQMDGVYWHGLLSTDEEYSKSKCGLAILKTKEKDKLQNQIIPNLIRITDEEFNKDPFLLEEKITQFFNTNFTNN